MKTLGKKLLAVACAALCFGTFVFAQRRIDAQRVKDPGEQLLYLPNERLLSHFSAGMSSIIADFLWIECLQYTGKHVRSDREFKWLKQMLNTVVRLDPYFVDAYLNGAIFLSSLQDESGEAIDFLKQGILKNPKAWELSHQIAMIYLLDRKEQYGSERLALHYLTMSAATGRAPAHVPDLAAKLQGDYDLFDIEEEMWTKIAASGDRLMQDLAAKKLAEVELRKTCKALDGAVEAYRKATGSAPSSLDELVRAGAVRRLPQDPQGGRFFLDPNGKVQSTTVLDNIKEQRAGNIRLAINRYKEDHGAWPPNLDALVQDKKMIKLPEYPYAGLTWKYDPKTGELN